MVLGGGALLSMPGDGTGRTIATIKYSPPVLTGMADDKRFSDLLVADVYETMVKTPSRIKKDASIRDAIELMIQNTLSRKVYVVDDDGKYLGTVNSETVLRLIGYRVGVRDSGGWSFIRFLRDAFKEDVGSIMVKGRTISRDTPLVRATEIMVTDHLNDLPVVDEEGKLIGELVSLELFMQGRTLFEPGEKQVEL